MIWRHKFWVGRYHMCIYIYIRTYTRISYYLYIGNKCNTFRLLEAINLRVTESVLDKTLRNWQLWKVGALSQFSHKFRKDCSNIHKPEGRKFPSSPPPTCPSIIYNKWICVPGYKLKFQKFCLYIVAMRSLKRNIYIPLQLHKPLLAIGTKPASPSGSPLASNTAVVRRPATSEPAKASVMDRTVVVSPWKGGNFAQNQNCPTKKPGRFTPTKRFWECLPASYESLRFLGKKPGLRRISTGRCCFFLQSRSIIYHNFFPPKLCL